MLTGFGKFGFLTQGLTAEVIAQDLLLAPDLLDFSIETSTGDSKKAKAWRGCKKVTVATAAGEEERTLTVQMANVDWATLQLAEGEIAENVNVTLPIWKTANIPATPFEIVDTAITAGNKAQIKAYLQGAVGENRAGHLTQIAAAPTARQFIASDTGTKLTFNSALEGGAIAYSIPTAFTSIPSIGKAPDPVSLTKFGWIGHACGDSFPNGVLIYIPLIQSKGKPSYNSADDVPTLELAFDCLTAPGERSPVQFFLMPAA